MSLKLQMLAVFVPFCMYTSFHFIDWGVFRALWLESRSWPHKMLTNAKTAQINWNFSFRSSDPVIYAANKLLAF